MATSLSKIKSLSEPPAPPKKKRQLSPEELNNFSNWVKSGDTKEMAYDLAKRGLVNASQLMEEKQPSIVTALNSKSVQSSWKNAAIINILQRARQFGIKTPTELIANKDVLIDKPEFKQAINHAAFKQIHPNFWEIVGGIYKDQIDKENNTFPTCIFTIRTKEK